MRGFSRSNGKPERGSQEYEDAYIQRPMVSTEVFRLIVMDAISSVQRLKSVAQFVMDEVGPIAETTATRNAGWAAGSAKFKIDLDSLENYLEVLTVIGTGARILKGFHLNLELFLHVTYQFYRSDFLAFETMNNESKSPNTIRKLEEFARARSSLLRSAGKLQQVLGHFLEDLVLDAPTFADEFYIPRNHVDAMRIPLDEH